MKKLRSLLVLIFCASFFINGLAQYGKTRTYQQKSAFIYWGYNRTHFTKSSIQFRGDGYNFTMKNATATDNPEAFSFDSYFSIDKITIPQFNIRAGYYFKNYWSVSIGYDHFKYVLDDQNEVELYGNVESGVDEVTNLSGDYSGESFVTNRKTFHYENSNGLNYIRVGIDRSIPLLRSSNRRKVGITSLVGASTGIIYSVNDFKFAGQESLYTPSISGFGLSLHSGLRFEFWDHLFFQTNLNGGYMNQLKVRTRPRSTDQYASQQFGFLEYNAVIGYIFRIKAGKDCDCPTW